MRNKLIFCVAVLLYSCDTRKDFNAGLNSTPVLQIRRDDNNFNPLTLYQQTIYDSLKLSQVSYYFDYSLQTNEIKGSVPVTVNILGSGLFQNISGELTTQYVFSPKSVGFQSVNLKAIDAYGLTASASLN